MYSSATYQVDPFLITAVMEAESRFNINCGYSSQGAFGLMQLMPDTAAGCGVDRYDPLQNVLGGTIYLSYCLDDFSDWGEYAVTYAVAAYNAGPQAVFQYGGVPPYRETMNYVNEVADYYQQLLYYAETY
ncbi:lytic transglycosylase domain-containing protein [uncultured Selenomonas sp.]|uniref:lytic transglycosylase domain-containing protein n=1 Tax=uncultured Selenomonas sp. TaxID=159275 RepID=UPI0025CF2950|nr:lytic transglycosylase domain-containing protein [uncultured Selenomonas sp.]